jgi:glutamate-ammonia-ligase adenylyltransferase
MAGSDARAPAAQLRAGVACGWLTEEGGRALLETHRLFSRVHQSGRLISDAALTADGIGTAGRAFLATQARAPDFETLETRLVARRAEAAETIDRQLPAPDATGEPDHD